MSRTWGVKGTRDLPYREWSGAFPQSCQPSSTLTVLRRLHPLLGGFLPVRTYLQGWLHRFCWRTPAPSDCCSWQPSQGGMLACGRRRSGGRRSDWVARSFLLAGTGWGCCGREVLPIPLARRATQWCWPRKARLQHLDLPCLSSPDSTIFWAVWQARSAYLHRWRCTASWRLWATSDPLGSSPWSLTGECRLGIPLTTWRVRSSRPLLFSFYFCIFVIEIVSFLYWKCFKSGIFQKTRFDSGILPEKYIRISLIWYFDTQMLPILTH